MAKFVYEIKAEDIRKRFIKLSGCKACGHGGKTIWLSEFMGYVGYNDIGKRIYEVCKNVYQVENNEQLKTRLLAMEE